MSTSDRPAPATRSRPLWRILAAIVAALVLLLLLVTGGAPAVPDRAAPTADQVGAARAAALQLRTLRGLPGATGPVRFGAAELDGIGALASHGFAPDRLEARIADRQLVVTGSHKLPLGRWLNVALAVSPEGRGFPPMRMTIGHLPMGETLTRTAVRLVRWGLARRGVPVPPLDTLVRGVAIEPHAVTAIVTLSPLMVQRLAALDGNRIDPRQVARTYCALTALQTGAPLGDVAAQVRRAFTLEPPATATAGRNRATFVALAMFLVDPRAGEMAGDARALTDRCRAPVPAVTLHGRADLTMHWTLSGALAVGASTQIAQAMGTWKELADSLSKQSEFAVGDPTGFSFLDLSADRSGFRIATAAARDTDAARIATALAQVTEDRILPPALMAQQDGLTNHQFVRHYGGISDPRYDAAVARIDAVLDAQGVN